MKPQHVIYMTGSGAVLYTWNRKHYEPVCGYDLPGGNPEPVVTYLRRTPTAIVAILVDVLEEEHNRDTITQLGRRDQNALLARKLARAFPRTNYRTAAIQGRVPNDPQTRRFLLSGLTRADHLRALQQQLAAAKLPVATVCSPALLSRPLLDKLRPANPADATLLVSRQREGSLRLTFFRGRDLVGSRLIRRSLAAAPGDLPSLTRQLDESVRYFDAAFAPSATNPVDVLLLCEHNIDPETAVATGTGHDGYRLHVPDPALAAAKLGLDSAFQAGNADLVFVELLRRFPPAGNFAPAADREFFQLHRLRAFSKAACVVLATAALVGTGLNGMDLLEAETETRDVRNSVGELTRMLDASPTEAGNGAVDPLEMERAVRSWRELTSRNVDPQVVLAVVSSALERQPRVQLDSISWSKATVMPTATDAGDGEESESENAIADGAEADSQPVASNSSAMWPRVRIQIAGRVEPFGGDYRLAFRDVHTFMESLRADPRVISVIARKQPLDVDPRSTLTGEVAPALSGDPALFAVDVLVRLLDESA